MAIEPPHELARTLLPMYGPCAGFAGSCASHMRWDPEGGHVPRGMRGAEGRLEEVRLVLVTSEPGGPYVDSGLPAEIPGDAYLRRVYEDGREHITAQVDTFNRNVRPIWT